ncbi:hypothetical protein OSJ57_05715 [Sphingomonas sp. HH69]
MAALSDLAPKLAKLIPMLGSNHDGEIVGTAKAIRRTLENGGLDLHALAEAIGNPPVVYRTEPARAEPSRSHQMDARRCLQSGIVWKPHEAEFLRQMASALRRPTEKQRDWLDGLLDRAARYNRGTTQ